MNEAELIPASAIVLAGGRSSRFGTDKLAVELHGEPLLHHAVGVVAGLCEEVLVVGAPSGLTVALPEDAGVHVEIVLDRERYEGPLVALVGAARRARHPRLLLVGGDMPTLQLPLLRRLLAWGDGNVGACLNVGGWTQPLPLAIDREQVMERGEPLRATGERSLRRLIESLPVEVLGEAEWRRLDPEARSLRDVDRPEDLRALGGA